MASCEGAVKFTPCGRCTGCRIDGFIARYMVEFDRTFVARRIRELKLKSDREGLTSIRQELADLLSYRDGHRTELVNHFNARGCVAMKVVIPVRSP